MTNLPYPKRRLSALATAVVLALTFILLVLPTALVALAQGFGLRPLIYELSLVLQRQPVAFPLHMIASGLSLILIPIAAFTRRRRGVHRAAGRLAAAAVAVGGLTALPVALASEAPAMARAGLFTQGIVWLTLLVVAVRAIRRGDAARHARFMLAMAAVASGAVWLRLTTSTATFVGLPFEQVYAVAAWACWLAPLALAWIATDRLAHHSALHPRSVGARRQPA